MRTGIIIAVVLILLIAVYYFFIKPKSSSNKPAEGSACSTGIGTPPNGTIKNGVCVVSANPVNNQIPIIIGPINTKPKFKAGDEVFLNINATSPATQDGIPVYKAPLSNAAGTYLLGVVRPDWYYPSAIGKYVSEAGNGWSRVTVANLKLWKFAGNYTQVVIYVTQDVFFRNSDIQNKPY